MNNEKLQINFGEGVIKAEVVIREVDHVNELPVKPPFPIFIVGTIDAPFEFLLKRGKTQPEQVDPKNSQILVSREELKITLIINENDEYTRGAISGVASKHPMFEKFGINTNKAWEPNELGQFFKMNRAYFPDKSENMKLVTDLKNFIAKVNTQIEKQKDDSGSFADNYSGVVTSNMPGKFKLKLPLFKGLKEEEFEVEFYANVSGRAVFLQLYSPDANAAAETIKNDLIDKQLEKIKNISPDIIIIEQ